MQMRWLVACATALVLTGCAEKKGGVLLLTVTSATPLTASSVSLVVTAGGRYKSFEATAPGGTLPPALVYGIEISPDALGLVEVTATAGGMNATGSTMVSAGAKATLTLTFGAAAIGDMAAPDFAGSPDLVATPDLASAGDLATSTQLSALPLMLSFNEVATNAMSAPVTVTITNEGTTDATGLVVSSDNAVFAIGNDTCTGASLGAGLQCSFSVTFAPTALGPAAATLSLGGLLIAATGSGIAPGAMAAAPSAHSFGDRVLGSALPKQAFTITNAGGVASGALTVGAPLGDSTHFVVSNATGCVGQSLAPTNGTCSIEITYDPKARGSHAASVEVLSPNAGKVTISVSGRAQTPATLEVTPLDVANFADVVVGSATGTGFIVKNVGDVPFTALPVPSFTGSSALRAVNQCDELLPAGAGCGIGVLYEPTAPGPLVANFTVTVDNAVASPQTFALTGNAISAANFVATPAAKTYAARRAGTISTEELFNITNEGMAPGYVPSVVLAGANAGDFAIVGSDCADVTLLHGQTCTVAIAFAPTSAGPKSGSLAIVGLSEVATLSGESFTCTDNDGDGVVTDFPAFCGGPGGLMPDCDDADSNIWVGCSTTACKDLDNDGFFAGCNRYVTKMPDCNDSTAWVTHDPEILGNGIDEDCDGIDLIAEDVQGIWLSQDAADDVNDPTDGTKANPVRTLTRALALAKDRGLRAIFMHGTVNDVPPPIVNRSIALFGGFDSALVRSPSEFAAIVNPGDGATITLDGSSNSVTRGAIVSLDRVTLQGGRVGVWATGGRVLLRYPDIKPGSYASSIGVHLTNYSHLDVPNGGPIYGGTGQSPTGIRAEQSSITMLGGTVYGASPASTPAGDSVGLRLTDPVDVVLTNIVVNSGNGTSVYGIQLTGGNNNGTVRIENATVSTGVATTTNRGISVTDYHLLAVRRSRILTSSSGNSPTGIVILNGDGSFELTSSVVRGGGDGSGVYLQSGTAENYLINNYIAAGTTGNPAALSFVFNRGNSVALNNYVVSGSTYGIGMTPGSSPDDQVIHLVHNIVSGGTIPGFDCLSQPFPRCVTSLNNSQQTCLFDGSYALSSSDVACKGGGAPLGSFYNVAIQDLQGQSRPVGTAWDVGPDDIVN